MFNRFSKAHLLWAAKTLSQELKTIDKDNSKNIEITINGLPNNSHRTDLLGTISFKINEADFLNVESEEALSTFCHRFGKIATNKTIREDNNFYSLITIEIFPDLATKPIADLMKSGLNPFSNNPGEKPDESFLLLKDADKKADAGEEHAASFFSPPPSKTIVQEPDLDLAQKLLEYIEMRGREKLYAGSWSVFSMLGFDRENKLEAAQLFYEVKFLGQNPDKLLKNESAIAALKQGRLGEIVGETVIAQLVTSHITLGQVRPS